MSADLIADRLQAIFERARRLDAPRQASAALSTHNRQPVVLFGAGALGRMALAHLQILGLPPIAMVDSNEQRWGTHLDGVTILSPTDAVYRFAKSARFVVTIYNGSAVRHQLERMGCTRVEHFANLYFEYPDEFLPFCGLAPRRVVLDAWTEIIAAASLWQDERSTTEFLAQLAWRLRLPECNLPPHDLPAQCYFPTNLFKFLDDEVLFDCGAFDGDSLRQYLALRPSHCSSRVVAFEPDPDSYARLVEYVNQLPDTIAAEIQLEPFAVAAQSGEVPFAALGSVCSGVAHSGANMVAAIALDEIGVIPTLIKMDVEGFELPALKGAADVMKSHQPVLAISLYHNASDIWTIPNFIKTLVPDYRLFLRRYAEDCWELVLYAIPGSRLLPSISNWQSEV